MDFKDVIDCLRKRIINQDEAITQIEEALVIAQAKLSEPDKPLCVLLFLGPTGVGKTETVKALTEAIHGNSGEYCRIDMSALSESHYAASLTGSPPGYVGSQDNETLLDKRLIEGEDGHPGILLLDEVEKAHPAVHQTLLQIFDNARVRLANGRAEVSFSNTIVVMTSNVGSHALKTLVDRHEMGFKHLAKDAAKQSPAHRDADRQRVAMEALERTFRPEFLNRIDGIVVFGWLDRQDVARILDNQLAELNARLAEQYAVELVLAPEASEFLVDKGFDQKFGARQLKRAVRNWLNRPLSQLLVAGEVPRGARVTALREEDHLRFETASVEPTVAPVETRRQQKPRPRVPHRHGGPGGYPFPYQIPVRYMRPRFH